MKKTEEGLKAVNGNKLQINYKLPNAVIQNNQIQIKTPFLLNQKFILRVDCKPAKDILQKNVQNIASK